jgi:PAP2 superfamily
VGLSARQNLRASEWLIIGYFFYVAVVAVFFFPPWNELAVAIVVTAVIIALARTKSETRDFAPLAFTLAAYREMDWFTPAVHTHRLEHQWIIWDRRLLDGLHLRAAIESLGYLFPSYFELCYFLVYAVAPVSIALLFIHHRRNRADQFWLMYLAGTLGVYALFPYFPSEPPRVLYPGADLPHLVGVIRRLNLAIVGNYGIHSSVFPSAHVSSTFSAAFGLHRTIPERPWLARGMAIYGLSVAIATVYGRYHYAVDGVAGIAIATLAAVVTRRISTRQ